MVWSDDDDSDEGSNDENETRHCIRAHHQHMQHGVGSLSLRILQLQHDYVISLDFEASRGNMVEFVRPTIRPAGVARPRPRPETDPTGLLPIRQPLNAFGV